MLTREQIVLLKRAQRQAGIGDDEYRELMHTVCGCRSSKDPRVRNEDWDALMSLFESIHWRSVDAGALQESCKADAPFRKRGYWSGRNNRQSTSRDRYVSGQMTEDILRLEEAMQARGYDGDYLAAVLERAGRGKQGVRAAIAYRSALMRLLHFGRALCDVSRKAPI